MTFLACKFSFQCCEIFSERSGQLQVLAFVLLLHFTNRKVSHAHMEGEESLTESNKQCGKDVQAFNLAERVINRWMTLLPLPTTFVHLLWFFAAQFTVSSVARLWRALPTQSPTHANWGCSFGCDSIDWSDKSQQCQSCATTTAHCGGDLPILCSCHIKVLCWSVCSWIVLWASQLFRQSRTVAGGNSF